MIRKIDVILFSSSFNVMTKCHSLNAGEFVIIKDLVLLVLPRGSQIK